MSKLWLYLIIVVSFKAYSFTHGKDLKSKHSKVFGGSKAVQSQYPYAVSVVPVLKSGRGASCSGALITDKWVITPAHCLNKTSDVYGAIVRAAVMDRLSEQGLPNTQDRRSTHFVINEGKPKGGKNSWDVALLEVSEPFIFDQYIRSIKIAKNPLPTTTMTCVAIGYGFTTQAGANINSYLYSLPTNAGDYKYCNKKNPNRVVGEEYVCLVPDSDNQAISTIDAGGLLVCGGLLVGVLHGKENNEGDVRDNCVGESCTQVYMFAGYFEPWIREHVANITDFQTVPISTNRQSARVIICMDCRYSDEEQERWLLKSDDNVKYVKPGRENCDGCGSVEYPDDIKNQSMKATFNNIIVGMLSMIGVLFN